MHRMICSYNTKHIFTHLQIYLLYYVLIYYVIIYYVAAEIPHMKQQIHFCGFFIFFIYRWQISRIYIDKPIKKLQSVMKRWRALATRCLYPVPQLSAAN